LLTSSSPTALAKAHDRCRVCGAGDLVRYLELGETPLANAYLPADKLAQPEPAVELAIQVCRRCGLSQLTRVVDRERMFREYLYVSSTSETLRVHCAELAETVSREADATSADLALDIASNDGLLLSCFRKVGLRVIGVDPARNLAAEANARGIPTLAEYWSADVAQRIVREQGRPLIITAQNVVGHVDDVNAFVAALDVALDAHGIFVMEVPYVLDFVERVEFDTAYHEHLSYWGVRPLATLFDRHGFSVFDVTHFPDIHGGTIRVAVCRKGDREVRPSVAASLERERAFGVSDPAVYVAFGERVRRNMDELRSLVGRLRARGEQVWAYGASAKGNTLMNFARLPAGSVPVVVDDNPKKWGLYTPGARMRIVGPAELKGADVQHLLLLAWNFEPEIVRRSRAAGYRGAFIRPVPAVAQFA
jgi:novobiocin biosynthesis protein NovU/D-mycarose 3-C-methyltransferase